MFGVKVTHELTDDDVQDMLVTAFEGGMSEWCVVVSKGQPSWAVKTMDVYECAVKGGFVVVTTIDEYDKALEGGEKAKLYTLDKAALAAGLEKVAGMYDAVAARLVTGDYDANDADVLLQVTVLGEVVYG